MTVSYINLIKAQQKPHALLTCSARDFASADDIIAAAKAVRGRLMGKLARPALRVQRIAPLTVPAPLEDLVIPELPSGVPLNLLTPCSWKFLVALAARRNGADIASVMNNARSPAHGHAKHDAMALVYQHTQASSPATGRLFGHDHSVVIHAMRKLGRSGKLVELLPTASAAARPKRSPERSEKSLAAQALIRQGYADGLTGLQIAEMTGLSVTSVYVRAHKMGLKHPNQITRQQIAKRVEEAAQ